MFVDCAVAANSLVAGFTEVFQYLVCYQVLQTNWLARRNKQFLVKFDMKTNNHVTTGARNKYTSFSCLRTCPKSSRDFRETGPSSVELREPMICILALWHTTFNTKQQEKQRRNEMLTSRGCIEQNDGQRIMSLTSLAWISSNDRIRCSLVWRILLCAKTQFEQRFSTQSRQRAVAWELSSQLVHLLGFCTANTVSMLLMKKLSGNASMPLAGTGTISWHSEHSTVRSWGLQ